MLDKQAEAWNANREAREAGLKELQQSELAEAEVTYKDALRKARTAKQALQAATIARAEAEQAGKGWDLRHYYTKTQAERRESLAAFLARVEPARIAHKNALQAVEIAQVELASARATRNDCRKRLQG